MKKTFINLIIFKYIMSYTPGGLFYPEPHYIPNYNRVIYDNNYTSYNNYHVSQHEQHKQICTCINQYNSKTAYCKVIGCKKYCTNKDHYTENENYNKYLLFDEQNNFHYITSTIKENKPLQYGSLMIYNDNDLKPKIIAKPISKKINIHNEVNPQPPNLTSFKPIIQPINKSIINPPGLEISSAISSDSTTQEIIYKQELHQSPSSNISEQSRFTPINLENEQSSKRLVVSPTSRLNSPRTVFSPTFQWNDVSIMLLENNYIKSNGSKCQAIFLGYNESDGLYHLFAGKKNDLDRNSFDTASRGIKEDTTNFIEISVSFFNKKNVVISDINRLSFAFVVRFESPLKTLQMSYFQNNTTYLQKFENKQKCSRFSNITRVDISEFNSLLSLNEFDYSWFEVRDVSNNLIRINANTFAYIKKMIIHNLHISSKVNNVNFYVPQLIKSIKVQDSKSPINIGTYRIRN